MFRALGPSIGVQGLLHIDRCYFVTRPDATPLLEDDPVSPLYKPVLKFHMGTNISIRFRESMRPAEFSGFKFLLETFAIGTCLCLHAEQVASDDTLERILRESSAQYCRVEHS